MKFVGADLFLEYTRLFRITVIEGRWGGGKTLLAVAIAQYWHKRGYGIWSNIPVQNAVEERPSSDVVLVLDEAWSEFMALSNSTMQEWFAWLRKKNQIVLLPSVLPLNSRFFQFRVWRVFNGHALGIPLFIYQWSLPARDKRGKLKLDSGYFGLFNPRSVWSMYDHLAQPLTVDRLWKKNRGE